MTLVPENRSFLHSITSVKETVSDFKESQIKYLDFEQKCDSDRFDLDTVHAIIRLHQSPLDCFDIAINCFGAKAGL